MNNATNTATTLTANEADLVALAMSLLADTLRVSSLGETLGRDLKDEDEARLLAAHESLAARLTEV